MLAHASKKKVAKPHKKSIKNAIANFLIAILLGTVCYCGYKVIPDFVNSSKASKEMDAVADIVQKSNDSENQRFSKASFDALKAENADLVGYLEFDSGIVSLPIVQASDNNYYLRKSFYKNYNEQGIPFMDSKCNLDSINITIYGHNVYYDDSAMFSPISFLVNQEKFEESQTFRIYFENEIRYYQITDVYIVDINEGFDFKQRYFEDEKTFEEWYSTIQSRNLISTNDRLQYEDNFVTLQTCKRYSADSRIVVIGKELSRTSY